MRYLTLRQQEMQQTIANRLNSLEREHFGHHMTRLEILAQAGGTEAAQDPTVQLRLKDIDDNIAKVERSIEALDAWKYDIALTMPDPEEEPAAGQPPA